ncbi:MAG: hypothetical protein WC915_04645 [archaeon]|jgi:hypothetical protein
MKSKIFMLISLICIIGLVNAAEYTVWLHSIDIDVDPVGNATIIEKYHLFFSGDEAKINFRQTSITLGSDLDKWSEFDTLFAPTIGPDKIINGAISYSEGEANYLEIKYNLAESLMSKGKETSYSEEYNIKATYFNKLYQSGLWVVPDNTRLTINLPPGAELVENVSPQATVTQNSTRKIITWNGHTSANKLTIKYIVWKKINPIIDLNELSNFLFRTNEGLTIIGLIIVCIGVIFWKRHYFSAKIEKFVEENTLFEED